MKKSKKSRANGASVTVTYTYSGLTEDVKTTFNAMLIRERECKNGRTDCDVECNKKID